MKRWIFLRFAMSTESGWGTRPRTATLQEAIPRCSPGILFSWVSTSLSLPPGLVINPPAGRYRLNVDAQSAFGSGRHESTQLMIKAMERMLTSGDVVLDIGCGSGI